MPQPLNGTSPQKAASIDRYYGRRKGRGLTLRKLRLLDEVLPALRLNTGEPPPADIRQLFPAHADEVWLEIGFGGGEHLAAQALANPGVGMIGAEPFITGVAKLVAQIQKEGIANIRVLDDDVRPLIEWLPPMCLARTFILFPDPWPKTRHAGRRIVNETTIAGLARAMRPGAQLRLATDIAGYARHARKVILGNGHFLAVARDIFLPPEDWVRTRYEAKAVAAGRRCQYLDFLRASA